MKQTEIAWLAGLFDGEGSILNMHKERYTSTWRITITNTSYPLLERVREVTGVGSINTQLRRGQKRFREPWNESWYWSANGGNARELLRRMLPYLIVKKAKAEQVLEARPT